MSFDALVANPGRLQILTALAVEERQEFVNLRRATQLTDGNLAAHAKRLQSGGLVEIDKQFRAGKPVTHFTLTPAGRKALEAHARRLLSAISHRRLAGTPAESAVEDTPRLRRPLPQTVAAAHSTLADNLEDDWVD